MSLRRSVRTAKCPYDELSYGELSYGEKSYGEKSGNHRAWPQSTPIIYIFFNLEEVLSWFLFKLTEINDLYQSIFIRTRPPVHSEFRGKFLTQKIYVHTPPIARTL